MQGGDDGGWPCQMVRPEEGLRIYSAPGSGQRHIRPYLPRGTGGLSSLNEGQSVEYEIVSNRLGLTQQQLDVLKLMMQEKSNEEICRKLGLSEPTIKNLITAIRKALNKFRRR
jgi:DNA-binding CsgD family transcriptional regulator